jgi:hypothetical protein
MSAFAAFERKLRSESASTATPSTPTAAAAAVSAASKPLEKPREPEFNECCGNGCSTCVWITYSEALQAYEESLKQAQASTNAPAVSQTSLRCMDLH